MKWQQLVLTRTLCVCPALAFVAGFVDAATFVRGGGVFCAHVTGNLIVIASQLVGVQPIGRLSLACVSAFIVTAALVGLAHRAHHWRAEAVAQRFFLLVEACSIALAWLLGVLGSGVGARYAVVLFLVVAMAVQTTLQRLTQGLNTVTTVMTGNLAQCAADLIVRGDPAAQRPSCRGRALALFLFGCGLGATSVGWLGFGALVIPLVVLLRAAWQVCPLAAVSGGTLSDAASPCCGLDIEPAE